MPAILLIVHLIALQLLAYCFSSHHCHCQSPHRQLTQHLDLSISWIPYFHRCCLPASQRSCLSAPLPCSRSSDLVITSASPPQPRSQASLHLPPPVLPVLFLYLIPPLQHSDSTGTFSLLTLINTFPSSITIPRDLISLLTLLGSKAHRYNHLLNSPWFSFFLS